MITLHYVSRFFFVSQTPGIYEDWQHIHYGFEINEITFNKKNMIVIADCPGHCNTCSGENTCTECASGYRINGDGTTCLSK